MLMADKLRRLFGEPMDILASCIRGMITAAPGNDLLAADFSAIEARGVAWLAGQEDVLDVFRSGADIYCHEASPIFGRTISKADKNERQVGKVSVLALGYEGGIGAYATMARGYSVNLDPVFDLLYDSFTVKELENAGKAYGIYKRRGSIILSKKAAIAADIIKQRWRRKNTAIVDYWGELNGAAIDAVANPGVVTSAGPEGRETCFCMDGSALLCELPSKRVLTYMYPRLREVMTPWEELRTSLHYKHEDGMTGQWEETYTYGGKLAENVTQAICRDLLAEAIKRCEKAGYPIVLHVHDELVCEMEKGYGDIREFEAICSVTPAWAKGLPIVAEAWRGERYRK